MSNETQETEHQTLLSKKAKLFHDTEQEVFITLKKDGSWERGWITQSPTADAFFLTYTEKGQKKHGIVGNWFFYLELSDIKEAIKEGVKGGEENAL